MSHLLHTLWRYLWPAPYTLLALYLAILNLFTGGRIWFRQGCFEVWGGFMIWILKANLNCPGEAAAATFGHVIFAQSKEDLDYGRAHEHIHVRQFERWGILMLPLLWFFVFKNLFTGKKTYQENPLELEAYTTSAD